jgi:hypothetical protein
MCSGPTRKLAVPSGPLDRTGPDPHLMLVGCCAETDLDCPLGPGPEKITGGKHSEPPGGP